MTMDLSTKSTNGTKNGHNGLSLIKRDLIVNNDEDSICDNTNHNSSYNEDDDEDVPLIQDDGQSLTDEPLPLKADLSVDDTDRSDIATNVLKFYRDANPDSDGLIQRECTICLRTFAKSSNIPNLRRHLLATHPEHYRIKGNPFIEKNGINGSSLTFGASMVPNNNNTSSTRNSSNTGGGDEMYAVYKAFAHNGVIKQFFTICNKGRACTFCDKTFSINTSHTNLGKHLVKVHGATVNDLAALKAENGQVEISPSDITFNNPDAKIAEEVRYIESYSKPVSFAKHMCRICGAVIGNLSLLLSHLKLIHSCHLTEYKQDDLVPFKDEQEDSMSEGGDGPPNKRARTSSSKSLPFASEWKQCVASDGRPAVKACFELSYFNAKDISVRTKGGFCVVEATRQATDDMTGATTMRKFCAKMPLPDGGDVDNVSSAMDDNDIVEICCPLNKPHVEKRRKTTPLNVQKC